MSQINFPNIPRSPLPSLVAHPNGGLYFSLFSATQQPHRLAIWFLGDVALLEKINTNDVPLTRVVPRRISCRYTPRDNTLHTRFQCFFALTDIGGLVSAHDPRRACRFLSFFFSFFSEKNDPSTVL